MDIIHVFPVSYNNMSTSSPIYLKIQKKNGKLTLKNNDAILFRLFFKFCFLINRVSLWTKK